MSGGMSTCIYASQDARKACQHGYASQDARRHVSMHIVKMPGGHVSMHMHLKMPGGMSAWICIPRCQEGMSICISMSRCQEACPHGYAFQDARGHANMDMHVRMPGVDPNMHIHVKMPICMLAWPLAKCKAVCQRATSPSPRLATALPSRIHYALGH